MVDGHFPEALTFDDVLLTPGYSAVLPSEVRLRARLTAPLAPSTRPNAAA